MRRIINIIGIALIAILFGCKQYWEDHYNDYPDTVDKSVWDAIKADSNLSEFVSIMQEFGYDTLFKYSDVYTLFIPTNEAVIAAKQQDSINDMVLAYHMARFFVQPSNIQGKKKIQTLQEKFALFENIGGDCTYDDVKITFESPLYKNGKYFVLDEVAFPKLNLYEYIAENNIALKAFIDDQDSIVLDKEKSKALYFDENGNMVYDSVVEIINLFEEEYFEVRTEYRAKTATIVFPMQEKYNAALDAMIPRLEVPGYTSHEDIPLAWQTDVLVPYLIDMGMFTNMREEYEFDVDTTKTSRRRFNMKNILGDSILIKYKPTDKVLCSNGYMYDYEEFSVLDSLYMSPIRNEGEWMVTEVGSGKFNWRSGVTSSMTTTYLPKGVYATNPQLSNDSLFSISFDKGYTGSFSLEFKVQSLFPRQYIMVVKTNTQTGGIYDIYVNDKLVREDFDWYLFTSSRNVMQSVISGKKYTSAISYNRFDCLVDNITEYGDVKVKFVYKGPGKTSSQGLVIDYIDFVPYNIAADYISAKESFPVYKKTNN